MKKIQIQNIKLFSMSGFETVEFNNAQDALLGVLYLKTGLILCKPESGLHSLMPDNLREYQNLMLMLKKLDSVIDADYKMTDDKPLLKKNINVFKHYFLDSWIVQNLTIEQQIVVVSFFNESIENKNKFIYTKLTKFIDESNLRMPESLRSDQNKATSKDSYRITEKTPSHNVSLSNVFEVMNQLLLKDNHQKFVGALSIAYSIVMLELIHLQGYHGTSKIHDLFHGKVQEFTYVENRTYGLYAPINLELQNISVDIEDENENETINLMDLNKEIKKIAKSWSLRSLYYKDRLSIEDLNKNDKKDLVKVISFITNFLFIYNGYHSTTTDDGVSIEQRFYERDVYFKQKKYTFSPSGLLYKILNLDALIRTTILENFNDNYGYDENGEVTYLGEDKVSELELNSVRTLISLIYSDTGLNKYILEQKITPVNAFINAWCQLLNLSTIDILPYSSFEFLMEISNKMKYASNSQYRINSEKSIERYKKVNVDGTGFYTDYLNLYKKLCELNTISIKSMHFDSISSLDKHLYNFQRIECVFKLMEHFNYNIVVKDKNSEPKISGEPVADDGVKNLINTYEELENLIESMKSTLNSNRRKKCRELLSQLLEENSIIDDRFKIEEEAIVLVNSALTIIDDAPKETVLQHLNGLIDALKPICAEIEKSSKPIIIAEIELGSTDSDGEETVVHETSTNDSETKTDVDQGESQASVVSQESDQSQQLIVDEDSQKSDGEE